MGDAPSTLHMVLPEALLGTPQEGSRIASIRETMRAYLENDVFIEREGLLLVDAHGGRRDPARPDAGA